MEAKVFAFGPVLQDAPIERFRLHPTFAALYPVLKGEERHEIKDSIQRNGQNEPITVLKDGELLVVIDGRNRLDICAQIGARPKYRVWEGTTDLETLFDFVTAANEARRHLKTDARAAIAAEIANALHGGDRKSEGFAPTDSNKSRRTLKAAASMMKVSRSTVILAKKRMREDPAAHAAAKAGKAKPRPKDASKRALNTRRKNTVDAQPAPAKMSMQHRASLETVRDLLKANPHPEYVAIMSRLLAPFTK